MTVAEAQTWRAYMARRGTLNVGLRLEQAFATLALYVHRAAFAPPHPTLQDLMPHVLAKSDDEPIEPEINKGLKETFELLTRLAPLGAKAKIK
jgi:hypothetical protein